MPSDTPQAFEPRFCAEVPASCCDYAVISHITGKEVCRVWDRDDAEKIARLMNAELTPTDTDTAIPAGEELRPEDFPDAGSFCMAVKAKKRADTLPLDMGREMTAFEAAFSGCDPTKYADGEIIAGRVRYADVDLDKMFTAWLAAREASR